MSVFQRTVVGIDGQKHVTAEFHYKFQVGGKRFWGVCTGCTNKVGAERYEKRLKEIAVKGNQQKSVVALYENFREELSGGSRVLLSKAFDLALNKPSRRPPKEKVIESKRQVWIDFLAYLNKNFPDVSLLSDVHQSHAEGYIAYIARYGRFNKFTSYKRGNQIVTTKTKGDLSSRTQIFYHVSLKEVFQKLSKDAGLTENPFQFEKIKLESETREAFPQSEIDLIYQKADAFTYPLFKIAFATALREGDICCLKWNSVNFEEETITVTTRKTNQTITIPVPSLMEDLKNWKSTSDSSKYVLPQHASIYLKDSTQISYRIKRFLNGIGIVTTKEVAGRAKKVSIKDLHSCRHTFCYLAGMRGIPLAVVQSLVGHLTPEMTKHYQAHATLEDQRQAMQKLNKADNSDRMRLIEIIRQLPQAEVEKLLKQYG